MIFGTKVRQIPVYDIEMLLICCFCTLVLTKNPTRQPTRIPGSCKWGGRTYTNLSQIRCPVYKCAYGLEKKPGNCCQTCKPRSTGSRKFLFFFKLWTTETLVKKFSNNFRV